jgi:tetrahydromethanopterin S-methyltransferase subunit B
MKIKDIINLRRIKMAGDKQPKAKPKAKPKTELKEETHRYARPFEVTGTGILFPDGTVQNSAQGGSAEIDPKLVTQLQQNTADIAKNAEDIAAIEIPEMPEIPDPIDAYTKAEVDSSQGAQDTKIAKNAGDIAAIESSTLSLQEKIQKLEQQVRELNRVDKK